jgi:FtsZ-interacting cell division protein ZipA
MQQDSVAVLILVVAIVVVAIAAWAVWRMQRRRALARKYGPEYERVVRDKGDARGAEKELEEREKRVSRFKLRDLTPAQRERHLEAWKRIQVMFVDEPARAAGEAHELLMEVMRDRGYPDADLAQRQRDLSVHYPDLIEPYRHACEIAARRRSGTTAVTTEDLRRATISYRSLLAALLNGRSTSGGLRKNRKEVA